MKRIFLLFIVFSFGFSLASADRIPNRGPVSATCLPEEVKIELLKKNVEIGIDNRPVLDLQFESETGKFLVHYDAAGDDAPPPEDLDLDGVPDYVENVAYYFERAWRMEVDTLGFPAPEIDGELGGSEAYDIYLVNFGKDGIYGATYHSVEVFPQNKWPRFASYITIDNDYSETDSLTIDNRKYQTYETFGAEALEITSVHEFNHACQMTAGEAVPEADALNELSSMWMERRFYPESKDYLQHVRTFLKKPYKYPLGLSYWDEVGYKWTLFAEYLRKRFGDRVIANTWLKVAEGDNIAPAFVESVEEVGDDFADVMEDFLESLYRTGSRARESELLDNVAELPELLLETEIEFSEPSATITGELKPFEIKGFRIILPAAEADVTADTLEIVATNADVASFENARATPTDFEIVCASGALPGFEPIENTDFCYKIESGNEKVRFRAFINAGKLAEPIDFAFPNPFVREIHEKLYFPAPKAAVVNSEGKLTIFSSDRSQAFEFELIVGAYSGKKVLTLDFVPTEITSGVYFFETESAGEKVAGKFAVR